MNFSNRRGNTIVWTVFVRFSYEFHTSRNLAKNNGGYRTSAQETNSLCYSKFSKLLYYIKTDQGSGIVNSLNGWFADPRDLVTAIKRIVYVSVESARIIDNLPAEITD